MSDLQSRRELSDYGELLDGEHRIITLGDNHETFAFKDEIIRALPQLKKAGIDTVAFEDMPVYMQPTVDDYFEQRSISHDSPSTIKLRAELLNHLKNFWTSAEGIDGKLLEMMDAIHANGMKLLTIEPDLPAMHKYPDENGDNAEGLGLLGLGASVLTAEVQQIWIDFYNSNDPQPAAKTLQEFLQNNWQRPDAETIAARFISTLNTSKLAGLDLSQLSLPADETALFLLGVNWRNENWKRRIETALKNGSTGVAVYGGICHFGDSSGALSLNTLLERDGYPTVGVSYIGGDGTLEDLRNVAEANLNAGIKVPILFTMLNVLESAAKLNLHNERFAVRMPNITLHWVVHLPETI